MDPRVARSGEPSAAAAAIVPRFPLSQQKGGLSDGGRPSSNSDVDQESKPDNNSSVPSSEPSKSAAPTTTFVTAKSAETAGDSDMVKLSTDTVAGTTHDAGVVGFEALTRSMFDMCEDYFATQTANGEMPAITRLQLEPLTNLLRK